ncbi:MAG TPA: hypothetical protein VIL77_06760 [Gaiellaceae bacterium]
MKSAPVLRGGPVARAVWLVTGLFLCAVGILCFLEARLGLPPWDVLHQGIARRTPLSFGAANEVVGVIVLAVAWALGARVWIGTVSNAVLIGSFIILLQPLHAVQSLGEWPLGPRVGLIAAGLVCFGVGTAFYIGANLGAGPRDSLMLVGSRRTGIRIGAMRAMLEISVLLVGYLLGGTVGLGTLAFAALIGPSVEASFWLVTRIRLT